MQERISKIQRVTFVGSVGNIMLTAFKFIAGFAGHSTAMVADAVHSLSDFISDVIVFIFIRLSGKPVDSSHNYGHGKYETLATGIVGIMLLFAGIYLGYDSAFKIVDFFNGIKLEQPGMLALIAAIASIVVKEGLYRYTASYGRKFNSPAVIANAWHHRSDAISSIATTVGIGGAILLGSDWYVLDPLAALFVSFFIIRIACQISWPAFEELMEKSLPVEIEEKILAIIMSYVQVSQPHKLRTRRVGQVNVVDVHVRMPGIMSVASSHEITRDIENDLHSFLGNNAIINIHVEPEKD